MLSNEELKAFEPWLISVARTGSSSLPWIENPRDTDYIFYVDNNRNNKQLIELFKLRPKGECWIVGELSIQGTRLYSYEYHYLKPIFGSIFPDYNIFEHITEHKKILIKKGLGEPLAEGQKFWYHILTGIYLLDNGEYELTEEQIENVQLCHARQTTEEIYNYIQQRLQEYKEELDI